MKRTRVAIAGYALEPYAAETVHSSEDLGFLVAQRAREMAGIARDEITSVHNSTMDLFDGVTISNGILQPAAGGYGRDGTRVQNGGLFAVISACASILCGASDVAVVSSVDAVSTDRLTVSNFSSHPLFGHSVGFNFINSCALFASAYHARRDVPEGDTARIAAKNYAAGAQNRYAHFRRALSADDVAATPVISSPLREAEVSLISSYGGSALVLVSEERAHRSPAEPLWITGFGMSTNPVEFQKQGDLPALRRASQEAYQAAGIDHPRAEIALSEINAPFALYEWAAYEALGFCRDQNPHELLESGATAHDGEFPINPSGGTLCTNAANSGGLFRLSQASSALTDGPHKAAKALVHDSDMSLGIGGDSHAVMIIEKEKGGER